MDVEGIGKSFVGEMPLVNYAFGSWQLYQATGSNDDAGNQYLVWKIEQQPARVPQLAEVRDDVVRAWKVLEARKPALARANALAETARKDTLTLAELAERDELPIEKPEPFSWLTYGAMSAMNTRIPPRLSEVKGIEDGGDDFMRVVFRQPEKGVAVAFNNPQTICYVIQVSEFEPGTEVLRRSFLADDYRTYARVLQPQQQQHQRMEQDDPGRSRAEMAAPARPAARGSGRGIGGRARERGCMVAEEARQLLPLLTASSFPGSRAGGVICALSDRNPRLFH